MVLFSFGESRRSEARKSISPVKPNGLIRKQQLFYLQGHACPCNPAWGGGLPKPRHVQSLLLQAEKFSYNPLILKFSTIPSNLHPGRDHTIGGLWNSIIPDVVFSPFSQYS